MINTNKFSEVLIEKGCDNFKLVERVEKFFPAEKIRWIDPISEERSGQLSADEITESKKKLLIKKYAGQFFKRCPGTGKGLACCNYFVLNLGQQCDLDCTYCYLQSFLNFPYTTIYYNIDQSLNELNSHFSDWQNQPLRVGTGEVIDSLSLDPLTLYSHQLIEFFNTKPKWKLEFKTKTHFVDQFLNCEHAGNTIVSWSLNPQYIIDQEERLTSSLEQRLTAAVACLNKKFPISFHIDPVIWHEGWQESYATLVNEITKRFTPSDIPFMSIGALRFQKSQRHIMRLRSPKSKWVTQGELFPGKDGKMRYDQSLREEMFNFIMAQFKANNPKWNIFLCMETPETWLNTFESNPNRVDGLAELFQPII